MQLKEFFDTEFKQFSIYDNRRSIPSVVDGFKPSQRKCIFGMVKRGEGVGEIKVAQASAYISNVSVYHHGEVSLEGTIVGLAQDYTGSNNINFLMPNGQFGSRLTPKPASSRYIFTELSKDFRDIFKKEDDIILEHLEDDGQSIEPKYYFPILPTVLINGSDGTGTGFASTILSYNPEEIRKAIIKYLEKDTPIKDLVPYYKGFTGTIKRNGKQTVIQGSYEIINTTTIKIKELPVGTYLDKYKAILNKLEEKEIIKSYDDNSDENNFEFTVIVPRTTSKLSHDELMDIFKLTYRDTENFTLWDAEGYIKKFESAEEIVEYFVDFRLGKYEDRRVRKLELLHEELLWTREKLKFVIYYINNHKKFAKKSKIELFELLESEGFIEIDKLLKMSIYTLTKDEISKLKTKISDTKEMVRLLIATNAKEMYIKELKELKL